MPTNEGTLIIQSVANGQVKGTLNFRGTTYPISGTWYEQSNYLSFQSSFAMFDGTLSIYKDPLFIHYTLRGNYVSTLIKHILPRKRWNLVCNQRNLYGNTVKNDEKQEQ